MKFTETEEKLLRLGLNPAAHNGEISAAAEKLFRSLRARGITADALASGEEPLHFCMEKRHDWFYAAERRAARANPRKREFTGSGSRWHDIDEEEARSERPNEFDAFKKWGIS